jgi:hypothetical protein
MRGDKLMKVNVPSCNPKFPPKRVLSQKGLLILVCLDGAASSCAVTFVFVGSSSSKRLDWAKINGPKQIRKIKKAIFFIITCFVVAMYYDNSEVFLDKYADVLAPF